MCIDKAHYAMMVKYKKIDNIIISNKYFSKQLSLLLIVTALHTSRGPVIHNFQMKVRIPSKGFCPLQVASIPQDGRWRLRGAAQSGLLCLTRSRCWAEGRGLRHSAQPCSLRRCEVASASSCPGRSRLQSASATPGRPPAATFKRIFGIWTQSLCERASYLETATRVLTSLQEATARCRGVSHLLSLAFTLAPTIETAMKLLEKDKNNSSRVLFFTVLNF